MNTMHVPIYKGDGLLEYEERPIPQQLHPGDVLVKIQACGICGTDLNVLATPPAHRATPNIVIGHEGVGIVEEVGPGADDVRPGDRVVIAPRLTCGECPYCRRGLDNQCTNYRTIGTTVDGAFAPYLRAPQRALYKISANVPRDDAVFFEPLSCVVGSVARVPIQAGDNVLVIGAGPMGLLFTQMFHLLGAGKIIVADIVPYRLSLAKEVGADEVLDPAQVDLPEAVEEITTLGADVVVDAVGNQIDMAIKTARRGGHVILFGLRPHDNPTVNQYTVTRYDLTLHGTFVGLNPFEQTIQLLESRRLEPSKLITNRVPLSQLLQGVDLMRSGRAMKVIVEN
jgi:threonine dehydrogenase-like Zn-dependent dehydrogenase